MRLEVAAEAVTVPPPYGLPYLREPARPVTARAVRATAIPYFQWDNRDGGAMRVWLPLRG